MMLTEQEAREKWCPWVRAQGQNEPAANRWPTNDGAFQPNPSGARCIASECMAWRWWSVMAGEGLPGRHGYCGNAGRPE